MFNRIRHTLIFGRLAVYDAYKKVILWDKHVFDSTSVETPTFLRNARYQ